MRSYSQYYSSIEKAFAEWRIEGKPDELYDPVKYMLSLGGKRLRPVLVLLAKELFGGNYEHALPAAMAVEVFHNFTLVHDDIMDKADIRRGKPTIHKKWNETVAILSGDLMMIKATDLLCETGKGDLRKLIQTFNETAIKVCEGQQLDMNYERKENVTRDEYIHMITLKTAVLLGCSLKLGAIIAEADESDQEHIEAFGRNIGIAFQIQDDILDTFGDAAQTGKKVGGDIASNKKTLLLIEALSAADPETRKKLENWLQTNGNEAEKIKSVIEIYTRLDVRNKAEELKNQFLSKAFSHLDSIQAAEEDKAVLSDIANELMTRMS